MSRCEAETRKGTRCRNEAVEGSRFCGVHREDAEQEPAAPEYEFMADLGEGVRTVLGLATVGTIVYAALKFGRRWRW